MVQLAKKTASSVRWARSLSRTRKKFAKGSTTSGRNRYFRLTTEQFIQYDRFRYTYRASEGVLNVTPIRDGEPAEEIESAWICVERACVPACLLNEPCANRSARLRFQSASATSASTRHGDADVVANYERLNLLGREGMLRHGAFQLWK